MTLEKSETLLHRILKNLSVLGYNENKEAMSKTKEEYSQSQLLEYKQNLKTKIKRALIGIDKTQIDDENGWWETSSGAEFGENKLIEVLTLIDKI